MGEAFAWLGRVADAIGALIPRLVIFDTRQGAVLFRTLRLRDLVRGRWDRPIEVVVLGPGIHLYWPLVSEFRDTIVARQSVNLATQTVTTADGRAVAIGGFVIYRLDDVVPVLTDAWHEDNCIRDISADVLHRTVCAFTWADLQTANASGLLRKQLRRRLRSRLKKFGVRVILAGLTDLSLVRTYRLMNSSASDV